jgi:hypothetical protein
MRHRGDLEPAIGHEQADRAPEVAADCFRDERNPVRAQRLPGRHDIPLAHLNRARRGEIGEHAGAAGDARGDPLRAGPAGSHQLEQAWQRQLGELGRIVRLPAERRRGEEDVGQPSYPRHGVVQRDRHAASEADGDEDIGRTSDVEIGDPHQDFGHAARR